MKREWKWRLRATIGKRWHGGYGYFGIPPRALGFLHWYWLPRLNWKPAIRSVEWLCFFVGLVPDVRRSMK